MIKKPIGYDEAPTYTGESQQLPRGKYVCIIKQVAEKESSTGILQFVILFDIAEGPYKDFYQKLFNDDKAKDPKNAKWRGTFKQSKEGGGISWFKGLITSIERSNAFTFPWDTENNEKTMVGKKFGGLFIRRQFEGSDGGRPVVTELRRIRSLAGLAEAELPEDEMLPEISHPDPSKAAPKVDSDGFMNIPEGADDEGIPFM